MSSITQPNLIKELLSICFDTTPGITTKHSGSEVSTNGIWQFNRKLSK